MDPQNLYTSGLTNLLIALTSVITAIGIVWVNVIVAKAKTRVIETADAVVKKAAEIGETTKTTLGHVNSAATEMRAVIEALRRENADLRVTASDNKQIAALLAASTAGATVVQAPALVVPPQTRDDAGKEPVPLPVKVTNFPPGETPS